MATSLRKIAMYGVLTTPFFSMPYLNSYGAEVPKGTKLAKDQVLNLGNGTEVPTLDIQKVEDTQGARVCSDLYEGLLTEAEDGTITPGIASKYEISKDQLTYTFHIRDNAKFSDGTPITADDVVFSFRRVVDPKVASTYSFIAGDIINADAITNGKLSLEKLGVRAVDAKTVEVKLIHPVPYFNKIIAVANFGIVKKENVLKYGDSFTQPGKLVSSGAYKMAYWKVGDKITLVKNPMYWNAAKTIVETVNFYPIVDTNSELQMYQAGQLDMTYSISPDQFKRLKATIPHEIKAQPFLSIYYFDLNMQKEPFKDNVKLRQALSMALDRNILATKVTGRGEIPAYDVVPKGTIDYDQQNYAWSTWPTQKRLEEARKLFEESGYSAKNPLNITISYNTDVVHKKITLAVASMWMEAFGSKGLKVDLTNQEWKVFLKTRQQGDFQVARDGWQADYNDASTFLNLFTSTNPQNNAHYKNLKYDALLKQASTESNPKKRQKIMQDASKLALADYPVIPVYYYVTSHLFKPYVGGYTGKNALDHMYTKNYYIVDHKK